MKIPFENRVIWLTNNLKNSKNLYQSYRYAGALELCLQELGVIGLEKLPEYQTGGKVYFGLFDFTWRETYPKMILRVAEEYLNKTKNAS